MNRIVALVVTAVVGLAFQTNAEAGKLLKFKLWPFGREHKPVLSSTRATHQPGARLSVAARIRERIPKKARITPEQERAAETLFKSLGENVFLDLKAGCHGTALALRSFADHVVAGRVVSLDGQRLDVSAGLLRKYRHKLIVNEGTSNSGKAGKVFLEGSRIAKKVVQPDGTTTAFDYGLYIKNGGAQLNVIDLGRKPDQQALFASLPVQQAANGHTSYVDQRSFFDHLDRQLTEPPQARSTPSRTMIPDYRMGGGLPFGIGVNSLGR